MHEENKLFARPLFMIKNIKDLKLKLEIKKRLWMRVCILNTIPRDTEKKTSILKLLEDYVTHAIIGESN